MSRTSARFLPAVLAALAACGGGSTSPPYDPVIPSTWAAAVTNPFFPLAPGTTWQYRSETGDGVETTTTEVLDQTRVVHGVTATAVHDRVFLDGELIEDTEDWYAEDGDGNVWYLGEDSKEIENGQVVSTEGSWEWGVDGALPGVIMWADPSAHVDEAYRQEFLKGVAEDWGKVVALNQGVTVPSGSFTGCIETEDWSGLESGREHKSYCPDIGTVLEVGQSGERTELVDLSQP